jgi:hypothetical protein
VWAKLIWVGLNLQEADQPIACGVLGSERIVAKRRKGARGSGKVDVGNDLESGRVLCLEADAAPGISADTLRGLYAAVQQALRRARD